MSTMIRIMCMCMLLILICGRGGAVGAPAVTDLRVGVHPDKIRIVLDLTGEIKYRIFHLENPYRIVLDTNRVEWQIGRDALPQTQNLLKSYRYGLFQDTISRLVFDLNRPAIVKQTLLLEPRQEQGWRLALDVVPSGSGAYEDAVRITGQAKTDLSYKAPVKKVQNIQRLKQENTKKIVVIDAGHGGVDPGAIAPSGQYEKDLVLRVALKAAKQLEMTGQFKVIMTRRSDVYVPLRDRVQIAQNAGADLFISIHADSFRSSGVRGASIYTLSNKASDKEAELLAARENKSDIIAGVKLEGYSEVINTILIDLAQRDTMNRSVVFARKLLPHLSKAIKLRSKPKKSAGFVVLKAPDVPSVLVELGYLTNAYDAAVLATSAGQADLVRAIRDGVVDYFFGPNY